MGVNYRPIEDARIADIACCPGGLELEGKEFLGRIDQVEVWHRRMFTLGLRGVVSYEDGRPRGFAEYMPAETAPMPIDAEGAAVLLCYHWAGTAAEDPEHLIQEKRLVEHVIAMARPGFRGMAALAWDHPIHFPIALLEGLGFREVDRDGPVALMWLPFRSEGQLPKRVPTKLRPQDLSRSGMLAVDVASSARCPYSLHHAARIKRLAARHPQAHRISLNEYVIDSHADARTFAASPWDWGWVYFNAEAVLPFGLPDEKITEHMSSKIAKIPSADSSHVDSG